METNKITAPIGRAQATVQNVRMSQKRWLETQKIGGFKQLKTRVDLITRWKSKSSSGIVLRKKKINNFFNKILRSSCVKSSQ